MLRSVASTPVQAAVRLLLSASALAVATGVSAQTATPAQSTSVSDSGAELAEIIVTANKVAEPVQRVPETINVVTASTLSDLHIQSVQEIATIVGGLSLTRTSPSELVLPRASVMCLPSQPSILMAPVSDAASILDCIDLWLNEL